MKLKLCFDVVRCIPQHPWKCTFFHIKYSYTDMWRNSASEYKLNPLGCPLCHFQKPSRSRILFEVARYEGQNWAISGKAFKDAGENNVKNMGLEFSISLLCDPWQIN